MDKPIFGILDLTREVFVTGDVLGNTYETTIAGFKTQVIFPSVPPESDIPETGAIDLIHPPSCNVVSKSKKTDISWGYVNWYPETRATITDIKATVNRVALLIESSEEPQVISSKLYSLFPMWNKRLLDYIILASKQHTKRDKNLGFQKSNIQLYDKKYIPNPLPIKLFVDFPDGYADSETVTQALLYASTEKELFLKYQMLLSSYEARRLCQNRRAILDACSAIELGLVEYIKKFSQEKQIKEDIFLNKFRTLGERFRLIKSIEPNLFEMDWDNLIVKPRNDMIHGKDVYPTDEVTDRLIDAVEQCLSKVQNGYYDVEGDTP